MQSFADFQNQGAQAPPSSGGMPSFAQFSASQPPAPAAQPSFLSKIGSAIASPFVQAYHAFVTPPTDTALPAVQPYISDLAGVNNWSKVGSDFTNLYAKGGGPADSNLLNTGVDAITAFFSPITTTFATAEKLPGPVGGVARVVNNIFGQIGTVGSETAAAGVQHIPFVSQQTKDALEQPMRQIGALVAQILAGKAAGDAYSKVAEHTSTFMSTLAEDARLKELNSSQVGQNVATQAEQPFRPQGEPTKVPVTSPEPQATIPVSTPDTRHAAYAASQGYEPYTPPDKLPELNPDGSPVDANNPFTANEGGTVSTQKSATEQLQELQTQLAAKKEALLANPARQLARYANKNGELPEVTGSGKSIFARTGDDIAKNKLNFPDSETARAAYGKYLEDKKSYQADQAKAKELTLAARDEKFTNDFLNKLPVKASTNLEVPTEEFAPEHVDQFQKDNAAAIEQPGSHIRVHEDTGTTQVDVVNPAEHTVSNEKASSDNLNQGQNAGADNKAGNGSAQGVSIDRNADAGPGKTSSKPVSTERGVSKIGKSIEAKAVEAKLVQRFRETAGYDKITIKDQASRAADLVNKNLDDARAIVRGEKPLPSGLRGTALITAMEEHIKANPSADLSYELANSPLTSATSAAAQELRLAAERTPDSATAKLQQLKDAKTATQGGPKRAAAKRGDLVAKGQAAIDKLNLPKEDLYWKRFLDTIKC